MKRILSLLKKILIFFNLIIKKKIEIKFSNPKESKILLIDHIRELEVKKALMDSIEFETFDTRLSKSDQDSYNYVRKPRIFINLKIFYLIIYYFFIKKVNSLYESYLLAYVSITRPNLILDTSHYGFLLKIHNFFPRIKLFYILEKLFSFQDNYKEFKNKEKSFHYYLIKFIKENKNYNFGNLYISLIGKRDLDILKDIYPSIIKTKVNFIIGGSFKANYIKKKNNLEKNPTYDFTYVSQIMGDLLNKNKKDDFRKIHNDEADKVLSLLSSYIKKNNLSCQILLRSFGKEKQDEMNFIKKYFGDYKKITFKNRENDFSSYHFILDTKVVISAHSQLTEEAMILNKKAFFVQIYTNKIYKFYPNKYNNFSSMWPWNIDNFDENFFEKKMNELLKIDNKLFFNQNSKKIEYMINSESNLRDQILLLAR